MTSIWNSFAAGSSAASVRRQDIPRCWLITASQSSFSWNLPSGKRLHNYGKSPCLLEKLTINGNVRRLCESFPKGTSTNVNQRQPTSTNLMATTDRTAPRCRLFHLPGRWKTLAGTHPFEAAARGTKTTGTGQLVKGWRMEGSPKNHPNSDEVWSFMG